MGQRKDLLYCIHRRTSFPTFRKKGGDGNLHQLRLNLHVYCQI